MTILLRISRQEKSLALVCEVSVQDRLPAAKPEKHGRGPKFTGWWFRHISCILGLIHLYFLSKSESTDLTHQDFHKFSRRHLSSSIQIGTKVKVHYLVGKLSLFHWFIWGTFRLEKIILPSALWRFRFGIPIARVSQFKSVEKRGHGPLWFW